MAEHSTEGPTMHLVVNWPAGGTDVVNLVPEAVATLRRVWVNKVNGAVVTDLPLPADFADMSPLVEWSTASRLEMDPTLALTVDHYDAPPIAPALPSTNARLEGFEWVTHEIPAWWRGTLQGLRRPSTWILAGVGVTLEAILLLAGHAFGAI